MACLLIFATMSFEEHKVLILMKFINFLIYHSCFSCVLMKFFLTKSHKDFLLCSCPIFVIVLGFIFWSKIHFKLIFLDSKGKFYLQILHTIFNCFSTICWKSFMPLNYCVIFVKNCLTAYIWASFCIFFIYMSILTPTPHCLEYCGFISLRAR